MASSSSSATVAVEKATSDLLIGPDWTMNMDICDSVNSTHWQAKDVVKALKKRLQHKSTRVQLFALTLLEAMVKNCGDYVHFQIVERNILGEMVKIVKKKANMQVRDKILILLDSWQEAFGGPGGKHPQYYWAFEELRRSGVVFPQRSSDAAPIFTPPVTHPTMRPANAGYGMPRDSSRRLDEAMASEIESLSLSTLDAMRNVTDLLDEMLQAVNPSDRTTVKDEVIVDLVNRCRSNQKKLMHMLTTTGDEELLGHGLELNDRLQNLLAKHDAIASGSPLPAQVKTFSPQQTEVSASSPKPAEVRHSSPKPNANSTAVSRSQIDEEEEEDDFAQLARRHSKTRAIPSQGTSIESDQCLALVSIGDATASSTAETSTSAPCTALALPDPPAIIRTTKEQDMIDLLSMSLSTTSTNARTHSPPASNQDTHQVPVSSSMEGFPPQSQTYPETGGQVPYNNYVVPWAQPQAQQQLQPKYPQYSPSYPPPPWAATPGYFNQNSSYAGNMFSTPQANAATSYTPLQGVRSLQHYNSFPSRGVHGSAMHGDVQVSPATTNAAPAMAQKPFVPSYRLFEDLNVLGNDGRLKPSLSGASGQGTVGGRK